MSHFILPVYPLELRTMEVEKQAKQLDSVTDVVQEQEVDERRALEAMSSLSTPTGNGGGGASNNTVLNSNKHSNVGMNTDDAANSSSIGAAFLVSKDDVDYIMMELEVSEAVARETLRDAATTLGEGESLLVSALRKLVTT